MASFLELNDTLQITKEQGFPAELDVEKHLASPYKLENFRNRIFDFRNKPNVRVFVIPPVRTFLVENKSGKWIYWGLCHILETTVDYINKTTSGKFKIIYLNNPEEMKTAHNIIDRNLNNNYFAKNN